ncbi:TetR/AcrR family transcriptional regulator [Salinimonas sediminis]|uniref:TetR/AcrR family transcriptional regulator n=1 Tax=Salinimonas sediminis TaxID=2303538 RepID=A0A346NLU9_9ALTE|nr:TetR/AcrR family transcriptional regulator [Salinimonas sediminis]AXR06506.1 TetR/AcrR family transcriptional regulator [Salinimonas sediminis]
MAQTTKIRIVDAAEALFAEQGFTQTSMRNITARAGVNLASVNYHFGSKKNLIQAVLKRYFDVLMPELDKAFATLPLQTGQPGIGALFNAMIPPMLALRQVKPGGTERFVVLLGRGYTETQGHLRRFIMHDYGATVHRLLEQIHRRLPHIDDSELFWRLHFAMGSFVFSMASCQALTEIAQADFNQRVEVVDVISHLVPFVANGIGGAPLPG